MIAELKDPGYDTWGGARFPFSKDHHLNESKSAGHNFTDTEGGKAAKRIKMMAAGEFRPGDVRKGRGLSKTARFLMKKQDKQEDLLPFHHQPSGSKKRGFTEISNTQPANDTGASSSNSQGLLGAHPTKMQSQDNNPSSSDANDISSSPHITDAPRNSHVADVHESMDEEASEGSAADVSDKLEDIDITKYPFYANGLSIEVDALFSEPPLKLEACIQAIRKVLILDGLVDCRKNLVDRMLNTSANVHSRRNHYQRIREEIEFHSNDIRPVVRPYLMTILFCEAGFKGVFDDKGLKDGDLTLNNLVWAIGALGG